MQQIYDLYQQFINLGKISIDTRQDVSGSIFFALSGENFNGNRFAEEALKKGAAITVIDQSEYDKGDRYFLVKHTLKTLQDLARIHRDKVTAKIIGITGSNGKTTTKELVSAVLATEKQIISTRGNLNNHIGVPLTVLSILPETEIAVVEMGANHPGEIALLCDIARPDIGIITNIGKAHLEGFGSFEGVIKAKNELYEFVKSGKGTVIVNKEDPLLMQLSEGISRITYGFNSKMFSSNIVATKPFLTLEWIYKGHSYLCPTKLVGKYNIDNVHTAIATGIYFGILPENINRAIKDYQPDNNRSQLLETETNRIILDAYNANPVSMTNAIENFIEFQPENPWLILGDMFELGKASLIEHQNIMERLKNSGIRNIMLVGKDFHQLNTESDFISFPSTEDADKYLSKHPIRHADILIKGSRGMRLEKLLKYL
jgi:UDP-N-acetylmuramoyl-tripeptide--D-alanyl-D-alanine ligase